MLENYSIMPSGVTLKTRVHMFKVMLGWRHNVQKTAELKRHFHPTPIGPHLLMNIPSQLETWHTPMC